MSFLFLMSELIAPSWFEVGHAYGPLGVISELWQQKKSALSLSSVLMVTEARKMKHSKAVKKNDRIKHQYEA